MKDQNESIYQKAKDLLKENSERFLADLFPSGHFANGYFYIGDINGSSGDSLTVCLKGNKFGVWRDHQSDDKGGDLLELLARAKKINKFEASKWAIDRYDGNGRYGDDLASSKKSTKTRGQKPRRSNFVPTRSKNLEQVWAVKDLDGNVLFYDLRFYNDAGKKGHCPVTGHFLSNGKFKRNKTLTWPETLPLYGLEKLKPNPEATIILCEGAKTADAAANIEGCISLAWIVGASAWNKTDFDPIFGRDLIIFPDNDLGGVLAATGIIEKYWDQFGQIYLLNFKSMPQFKKVDGQDKLGWDVADYEGDLNEWIKEPKRVWPIKRQFDEPLNITRLDKVVREAHRYYGQLKEQLDIEPKVESKSSQPIKSEITQSELLIESEQDGFFISEQTKRGVIKKPDLYGLAKFFQKKFQLKTSDGFMYIWEDQFYKSLSRQALEKLILIHTKEQCSASHLKDFSKICRAHNHVSFENFQAPPGYLNLKNGILNIDTQELIPHSPDFAFKYKLPHEYVKNAYPEKWLNFLFETFQGKMELVDLSAEIFGYTLIGGDPWLHKAFILLGDGRNGKSTYIDVLKYILGSSNVCAIPMQSLGKPFSVVTADGKLANIVGETTAKEVDSDDFKTAVSGEELPAARKGQDEYYLKFQARMFFACNKMPIFKDTTSGNIEKLCIIPFSRYLKKEERIPEFARRFLYPEVSGIINWAIDGYKRLKERGRLPDLPALEETLADYKSESNSVFAWFSEAFIPKSESSSHIYFVDNYQSYLSYCDRNNVINRVNKFEFGRRCRQILYTDYPYVYTNRDKKGFYMRGGIFDSFNVVNMFPGKGR